MYRKGLHRDQRNGFAARASAMGWLHRKGLVQRNGLQQSFLGFLPFSHIMSGYACLNNLNPKESTYQVYLPKFR